MTLVTRRARFGIALATSVITAATGLTLVPPRAAASADSSGVRGGSGVITTYGVGPHRFEVAHPRQIRVFAGRPNSRTYENKLGEPTTSRTAVWQIWRYSFSGGGYVYYSFHRSSGIWVFVEVDTNRTQFSTAHGTRVGMSYAEARMRDGGSYVHGCIDSGFWHFRDRHRYAVIVGVARGQSVHALHAYGPGLPLC